MVFTRRVRVYNECAHTNHVVHPDNKPDTVYESARGPHSLPMWIAEARSPADFSTMVPWMVMNHGNISVLVHPNTDNPKRVSAACVFMVSSMLLYRTSVSIMFVVRFP